MKYGNYGIPLAVQQALNNVEKSLNDNALNEREQPVEGSGWPVNEGPQPTANRLPLNSTDLPIVLFRIENTAVYTPEGLEKLKQDIAGLYGSDDIPEPVQQALNVKQKTFESTQLDDEAKKAFIRNIR